jgi:hypothetical protein
MAKNGVEHFTVRQLKEVQYSSIIELQLAEEELIRDFGTLNTIHNNDSGTFGDIDVPLTELRQKKNKQIIDKEPFELPPRQEMLNMAMKEATKVDISWFIDAFMDEKITEIMNYFGGEESMHLTRAVLQWFGYEGEECEQKRQFIRMLKRNNIPFRELKHTDKEIELYPTIKEEMALVANKGAVASKKWLVMEPYDIKMAMLRLNTKNSDTIK